MTTIHNDAQIGQIAETILLPGDPLRAKYIANNYLDDVIQFSDVRNMFGYTGRYKGKRISVMGTGMGNPSIGIYTYELIHHYGVKNLIRIGSCGGAQKKVKLGDLIFAMGASTNSNYGKQYNLDGIFSALASYDLLEKAVNISKENSIPYHVGNVFCSDVFYRDNGFTERWAKMGILGMEMETYALYCNAATTGVKALGILTTSDSLVEDKHMATDDREIGFNNMIKVALELSTII